MQLDIHKKAFCSLRTKGFFVNKLKELK